MKYDDSNIRKVEKYKEIHDNNESESHAKI
jgi:hypothetical protein